MSAAAVLQADCVTHRYGGITALRQIDLTIAEREFLVMLGPSGCGKSTLLNLFAGFEQPSEGRVLLRGDPIAKVEPRCGVVFQNYALFPWLTVAQNIAFGPSIKGIRSPEKIANLIRSVGIEGFGDLYPNQLSGGMKQRVALARTLANDPEVLLCDEPFAAVDAMTRQVLQEELSRIATSEAKTVLFITHSIDEAILLADRIVVLSSRPGRVKESLPNPLQRPRTQNMLLEPESRELKQYIWRKVREEVLMSLQDSSRAS